MKNYSLCHMHEKDAEYLAKKTAAQREQEEVIHTLSQLRLPDPVLRNTILITRPYIQLAEDLQAKKVPQFMREYWEKINGEL